MKPRVTVLCVRSNFLSIFLSTLERKIKKDKMIKMLEVLANYVATRKRGKNGKTYESPRIYLPTKLTCDSGFPMAGRLVRVRVKVEGKRLLVERASRKDLARFGELPAKRAKRKRRRKSR
jgi:hypothetical protein